MQRRRKVPHTSNVPIEALPVLDTYCGTCLAQGIREFQRESDGGPTCKFGHGGADGIPVAEVAAAAARAEDAKRQALESKPKPSEATFQVREGDSLVVNYSGAKLQIAPYTTVEIDSAIYTRRLEPGDDPAEEFERVYAFVRDQCIKRARAKLATFADELAKAKKRAAGE